MSVRFGLAVLLASTTLLTSAIARADDPARTATFSIVAADPEAGLLGVAVASKYPKVGKVVPAIRPGVAAFCTQHYHVPGFRERAMELLAAGRAPAAAISELLAGDDRPEQRQLALVDQSGRVATHHPSQAGADSNYWGGIEGRHFACQGNTLAGREVLTAMAAAFESGKGTFADRIMAALVAGDAAGGDHRGRLAAGIRVCRKGTDGDWLQVYVDEHDDAVRALYIEYLKLDHEARGPLSDEQRKLLEAASKSAP